MPPVPSKLQAARLKFHGAYWFDLLQACCGILGLLVSSSLDSVCGLSLTTYCKLPSVLYHGHALFLVDYSFSQLARLTFLSKQWRG